MLHDIGKLVYLKFYPDHYRELRAFSKEQGCLFSQGESDLSLPSSAYCGTVLCDRWKLPDQARRGSEFHTLEDLLSTDEDSPPSALRRMICLGNLIAVLSRSELNNVTRKQIADVVKTELNCSDEDFLALMGDIYHLQAEVEDFVGQFT